jgi:hypothetical protein
MVGRHLIAAPAMSRITNGEEHMSKIDDAKQKIIDAQSIQSLITIALDAGDDSGETTTMFFASKKGYPTR